MVDGKTISEQTQELLDAQRPEARRCIQTITRQYGYPVDVKITPFWRVEVSTFTEGAWPASMGRLGRVTGLGHDINEALDMLDEAIALVRPS